MAALPLGVFSRTEQRVLQAIFKAIVDGDGCCVATLATLARASNTSHVTPDLRRAVLAEPPDGQGCPQVGQVNLLRVVEEGIDQGDAYDLRLRAPENGPE